MEDGGFSHAFEAAMARLGREVDEACAEQGDWPHGVAAGIGAALELGARDPAAMQLLTVDVFDEGAPGALRYRRLIDDFAARLTAGREHWSGPTELPPVFEEALVGAIATPIAEAVRMGREDDLPEIAPELVEFVLTPYLGVAAAKRVGGLQPR